MDHEHGHEPMHMDMMKMYFHIGMSDKNVLIYGWDVTHGGRMAGMLIAVFLLAAFYEWIKWVRVLHHKSSHQKAFDLIGDADPPQSCITQVCLWCAIRCLII